MGFVSLSIDGGVSVADGYGPSAGNNWPGLWGAYSTATPAGGTGGDPDFKVSTRSESNSHSNKPDVPHHLIFLQTWQGYSHDWHGHCDLVLLHAPDFGNGKCLSIHVRSSPYREIFSYISDVAIRIGNAVLDRRRRKPNHSPPRSPCLDMRFPLVVPRMAAVCTRSPWMVSKRRSLFPNTRFGSRSGKTMGRRSRSMGLAG